MFALRVPGRINLIAMIGCVGLLVVLGLSLIKLSATMHQDIANATRANVETAYGVMTHFHDLEERHELSRADAQRQALSTISALRYGADDYFWVHDMYPHMLMHPFKPELDGKDISEKKDADGHAMFKQMAETVRAHGEGFVHYRWEKPGSTTPVPKISFVKGFAPWGWVIGSGVYVDTINAEVWGAALWLGAIVLVAAFAAGLFSWYLGKSITRPMDAVIQRMRTLAEGDTNGAIPGCERADELGEMADALIVFRDAAIAKHAAELEQQTTVDALGARLGDLAEGNLVVRVEGFPPAYDQIRTDYNNAVDALAGAMVKVRDAILGIGSSAANIRGASEDLAKRTESQAASLEKTALAMNELTSTVKQATQGAESVDGAIATARAEAEQSRSVLRDTIGAMGKIEGASNEIAEIISVIDGIAFQTNLLALNAGVEAARAGDAGRGFAVVAAEVRALAQRAAEAANDVKGRIHGSAAHVGAGVKLVNESSRSLECIIDRMIEISAGVSQITASTRQQAVGLEGINKVIADIDRITQNNAAMSEEVTAAANKLESDAEMLSGEVALFRLPEPTRQMQIRQERAPLRIAARN